MHVHATVESQELCRIGPSVSTSHSKSCACHELIS